MASQERLIGEQSTRPEASLLWMIRLYLFRTKVLNLAPIAFWGTRPLGSYGIADRCPTVRFFTVALYIIACR